LQFVVNQQIEKKKYISFFQFAVFSVLSVLLFFLNAFVIQLFSYT